MAPAISAALKESHTKEVPTASDGGATNLKQRSGWARESFADTKVNPELWGR